MCSIVTVMCVSLVLLETRASIANENRPCLIEVGKKSKDSNSDISTLETTRIPCTGGGCYLIDVAWNHLLASCGPRRAKRKPRSLMLREAALIARSVGLRLGSPSAESSTLLDIQADNGVAEPTAWNTRLVSVAHKDDIVSVQVAWDRRPRVSWYLVTWELEGGPLRGNLLSDSSSATLSLMPDKIYHVQIIAVESEAKSECLLVDLAVHGPPSTLIDGAGVEAAMGAVAAVVVFLAVALLLIRTRRRPSFISKDIDQIRDYNHFKLYPPPITLQPSQPPPPPQGLPHQRSQLITLPVPPYQI